MTDLIAELAEVVHPRYDAPLAEKFLRTHHAELTQAIESRAELLAAHEALVIRLGEVTTKLEAAERDAAKWKYVVNHAEWIRDEEDTLMAVRFSESRINLESVGMRTDAIDAAMRDSAGEE